MAKRNTRSLATLDMQLRHRDREERDYLAYCPGEVAPYTEGSVA